MRGWAAIKVGAGGRELGGCPVVHAAGEAEAGPFFVAKAGEADRLGPC